jgi:hypothetical protein
LINEGILCKAESAYGKDPWTITTVHTNGTSGFNTEPEQIDLVLEEYNHLQMILYKLNKNTSRP